MPTVKQVDKAIVPAVKIVGSGIVLYGLYKVGQKVGIFETKEDRLLEEEKGGADESAISVNTSNPFLAFSPSYRIPLAKRWTKKYRTKFGPFSPSYQFKGATDGGILASRIHSAVSVWGDNEEQIYAAFRNILTQYQLSFVAQMFYNSYKQDLLQFLVSALSDSEMMVINNMVRNYPLYYVPKK